MTKACESFARSAAEQLIEHKVASRIFAKDASLYDFSEAAQACARDFMGWADLATNPPYSIEAIQEFADAVVAEGIETVVLIGQGGSTQAPMTITKYNKLDRNRVDFKTIDSDSPIRFRGIFADLNPRTTLFLVSSKSGTTLEPQEALFVVKKLMAQVMPQEEIPSHLVAVTDPNSSLAQQAIEEGWRAVFYGEPSVGGRYSAMSVFGLLPAALVGIPLDELMEQARAAERACSVDALNNPAIVLAAFLYGNYMVGRDKFSFLSPKRGRVLGLWIEQLVAESLGKDGQGILPNIEVDSLLLCKDPGDRCVIMYETKNDLADETVNFLQSLNYIDPTIPQLRFKIDSVEEVAMHFIMWEYAIAMCGYLMNVCPFDQPDVASAKAAVLTILQEGTPKPQISENSLFGVPMGTVETSYSAAVGAAGTGLQEVLRALMRGIRPGDYFGLLAFLPFTGEGRREALENIRHDVANQCGIPSCLEVGPRYLHSTGQLHKGGPNKGVFLIVSAEELSDIEADERAGSMGSLAKAQAAGDFVTLAQRGRRCVHVHLPDNTEVTLRALERMVNKALNER